MKLVVFWIAVGSIAFGLLMVVGMFTRRLAISAEEAQEIKIRAAPWCRPRVRCCVPSLWKPRCR